MTDILAEICARKRRDLAETQSMAPLSVVTAAAKRATPPRGFANALRAKQAAGSLALIAEIKRASPSGGMIRTDFDPSAIAQSYQRAGAACLSVLTDGPHFQGAVADLQAARAVCSLPVLRKDFMVDPYQIVEARAIGADCILLIMAALDDILAAELEETAREFDLDVLVEVHNQEELDRALKLKTPLLGINNRNLKTLVTDLGTTVALARDLPPDRLLVSESGLKTHADLKLMAEVGARSFLVGESLLRQDDIEAATRALLFGPA